MRQMKNSGIEWIGDIPDNWMLIKGKYLFKQRFEKGNKNCLQLLSPTQNFGVIPQDVYEKLSGMTAVKVTETVNLEIFKSIHKGDYCISLRSFQGGFEYSNYEGVVSPAYQVFYPIALIDSGYYKYLFKDVSFIKIMNSYTMSLRDGKNIAFDDFGNTFIPIPPLSEQKAIAGFLDKKCGEVDALIADIQQEIETLEQYKRSVITEAVTKGLAPSVPMKESGVGWMPTIPAHWVVHPLYYYFEERKNKNIFAKEHNLLSLSYGKIIRKDINANGGVLPENFNAYNIVEPKDIVLRLTDLQNDKRSLRTGFVNERGIITSAYITLRAKKDIMQEYFYYELHVFDLLKGLYNMGSGVRQGLNFDELSKLKLFEPTMKEQMEIVAYIKEKEKKIEEIIAEKQSQIETLESYKKSLIYEYVTGKKEVIA